VDRVYKFLFRNILYVFIYAREYYEESELLPNTLTFLLDLKITFKNKNRKDDDI